MIRWKLFGACLLTAFLALGASASEPASTTESEAPASEIEETKDAPSVLQGLTVTRDPESGALGAPGHAPVLAEHKVLTEEIHRMLAAKLAASPYGMPPNGAPVKRGDGVTQYRLGLENLSYSIVRVAEDGTLVQDCTDGEEAAGELLAQPLTDEVREDR